MIPQVVASLLPASLAEIQASSALAGVLRDSLEEAIGRAGGTNAATFFQFVNYLRSQGVSGQDFGALYREAKYWTAQGSILNQYPEGVPFDPRLARDLETAGKYAAEFGGYKTRFTVTLTDRESGSKIERYVWVRTDELPELGKLRALVQEEAREILKDTVIGGQHPDLLDYDLSYQVSDFGRIT